MMAHLLINSVPGGMPTTIIGGQMEKQQLTSLGIGLVLISTLAGCDEENSWFKKYEIREVLGQVYLLNATTGDVFVREGLRLVELHRFDNSKMAALTQARLFKASPVKGLSFDVEAKLRGTRMPYRIIVSALKKSEKDGDNTLLKTIDEDWKSYWDVSDNSLNFNFIDNDGFIVKTIAITLAGLGQSHVTRLVNEQDEVTGYEYEGTADTDIGEFEAMSSINVTYILKKPIKK
jgi:hypothetical protein